MAGTYVQKRDLSASYRSLVIINKATTPTIYDGIVTVPGDQVTRSFRTNGSPDELVQDEMFYIPVPGDLDNGHPFDTVKRTVKTRLHGSASRPSRSGFGYSVDGYGPALLTLPAGQQDIWKNFLPAPSMSQSEINTLGGKLIKMARPTAPDAGLANMLGELKRDGLPFLPLIESLASIRKGPRGAGGSYLGVEFGVKPLLSDLRKIIASMRSVSSTLEQYRRDSGKIIRRRRQLPDESRTETWTDAASGTYRFVGQALYELYDSYPIMPLDVLDRYETRTWFSGAFSYYLDVGDDALSKLRRFEQEANRLFGTRVSAETLWELAPWSWLIDWFANVGDVISNANALTEDGLVIRYGYLMRHSTHTRYLTYRPYGDDNRRGKVEYVTRYRTERKERARATPYGFGLTFDGFSPRQLAILGALGISRAPRISL